MSELTPREREILILMYCGFSSSQIADKLAISKTTVETHKASVMRALKKHGVHRRKHLTELTPELRSKLNIPLIPKAVISKG